MKVAKRGQPEATGVGRRSPVHRQMLAFSFVAFFTMTLLTPALTFSGSGVPGEGSMLRQVFYALTFVAMVVSVRPAGDPARMLVIPWPIVLALAWCACSLLWSVDSAVGARRLILTAAVMWSLFLSVRHMRYEQTVALVRGILLVTLIGSIIAVLIFPQFGVHQLGNELDRKLVGNWRGIVMNKNIMGAVCAMTVLFFLFGGGLPPGYAGPPSAPPESSCILRSRRPQSSC